MHRPICNLLLSTLQVSDASTAAAGSGDAISFGPAPSSEDYAVEQPDLGGEDS